VTRLTGACPWDEVTLADELDIPLKLIRCFGLDGRFVSDRL
jgi:hypothetical protein